MFRNRLGLICGMMMFFFGPDGGGVGGDPAGNGKRKIVPGDYKGMISRVSRFKKRDDSCSCTCAECQAGNCCGKENCRACEGKGAREATTDFTKEAFPVVVASEEPVMVWDWDTWRIIREVLLMSGCQLPENRQVVLLDTHSCYGGVAKTIKGSCRELAIEGSLLVGNIYFSSLAKDECTLVREEHLTDTSCGYQIDETGTIVLKPGASVTIEGRVYVNNFGDDLDLYIRQKWTPKEESLVPIGADDISKFREDSLSGNNQEKIKQFIESQIDEKLNNRTNILLKENEEMAEIKKDERTPEQIIAAERERIAQIEEYGTRFAPKLPDAAKMVREAITNGTDVNIFRSQVLDNLDTRGAVETPNTELGLSAKDQERFSLTRGIAAMADGTWNKNSFEREVSEAVMKKAGVEQRDERSFFIPSEIQKRLNPNLNTRSVLSTASAAIGGDLVGTDFLSGNFVDFLRNKAVLAKLGVTILSGLRKNIAIPKQLSTSTFEMVGYGAATPSNFTVGQITATPHYGSTTTEYHRSLILQGEPSIDALITNDLFGTSLVGIDRYGIFGVGGAIEPKGFTNETGVGTVDCAGGVTWAKIIEFITKIERANADQLGEIKWLLGPELKAELMTTPKVGTFPVFIMGDDGKIAGYNKESTNQVDAKFLSAGIWKELVLCDWQLYEILVNPFGPNSKAGNIEVTMFSAFDYVTRRASAFVMRDDA